MESKDRYNAVAVYQYTRDPTVITRALKWVLYVSLALATISTVPYVLSVAALYRVPVNVHLFRHLQYLDGAFNTLNLVLYFVTAVIFLRWVYVASSNCRGFNAEMTYSPGWAVGYYFIPVLNLFVPYLAMSEIRRVSTDPENPRDVHAGPLLLVWWLIWIGTGVVDVGEWVAGRHVVYLPQVQALFDWLLAYRVISVLAFVMAILVVMDISRRQRTLVEQGPFIAAETPA